MTSAVYNNEDESTGGMQDNSEAVLRQHRFVDKQQICHECTRLLFCLMAHPAWF